MKKNILEQVILEAKKRLAEEYLELKMLEEELNSNPSLASKLSTGVAKATLPGFATGKIAGSAAKAGLKAAGGGVRSPSLQKNWEAGQNAKNQQIARRAPTQIKKDATAHPANFIAKRTVQNFRRAGNTARDAVRGAANVMKAKYPEKFADFKQGMDITRTSSSPSDARSKLSAQNQRIMNRNNKANNRY